MLLEQIKSVVSNAISSKVSPLENIILNSQYHCLAYAGQAGQVVPANIPASFNQQILAGKKVLIKSIKLIPYASENTIDISLSDGTTETVPPNMRLQRTMERFSAAVDIRLIINGGLIDVFSIDAGGNNWFPLDLSVDNIYYNYKAPVNTIEFQVAALNFVDWVATGAAGLNVVVLLECYTY